MLTACAAQQRGTGIVYQENHSWGDDRHRGKEGGHFDAVDRTFGTADLPDLKSSIASGARAGLIGGAVMTVALSVSYNSAGISPLLPLQVLMLSITGSPELSSTVFGLLTALAILLIGSIALGALFGLLMAKYVGRLGILGAAGVGMIYGLLIWIISQFVILGFLAPSVTVLYDQNALALSHAIYGFCLGLFGGEYQRH